MTGLVRSTVSPSSSARDGTKTFAPAAASAAPADGPTEQGVRDARLRLGRVCRAFTEQRLAAAFDELRDDMEHAGSAELVGDLLGNDGSTAVRMRGEKDVGHQYMAHLHPSTQRISSGAMMCGSA